MRTSLALSLSALLLSAACGSSSPAISPGPDGGTDGGSFTVPGAPSDVMANAGQGEATVSWSLPTSNGGTALTGFIVSSHQGTTAGPQVTVDSGIATSTVVTGLTNGATYTFTVAATNAAGKGRESLPSSSITIGNSPPSGVAYSPSALVCTKGAACSLAAPSSTGGTITSFSIMPTLPTGLAFNTSSGAITGTPTVLAATAAFTVTATNAGGSENVSLNVTVSHQRNPGSSGWAWTRRTLTPAVRASRDDRSCRC